MIEKIRKNFILENGQKVWMDSIQTGKPLKLAIGKCKLIIPCVLGFYTLENGEMVLTASSGSYHLMPA